MASLWILSLWVINRRFGKLMWDPRVTASNDIWLVCLSDADSLDAMFWLVARPLLLMHFNCFSGRFWIRFVFFGFCSFSTFFLFTQDFYLGNVLDPKKHNVIWSILNYKSYVSTDCHIFLPYFVICVVVYDLSPEAGKSWAAGIIHFNLRRACLYVGLNTFRELC